MIAIGQRWGNYTVKHICKGPCNYDVHVACASEHVHYFEGGWDVRGTLGGDPDYPFRGWAPGYGPASPERPVETREYHDGHEVVIMPIRCLACDVATVEGNRFACIPCVQKSKGDELSHLHDAWRARFPRSPGVQTPPAPPRHVAPQGLSRQKMRSLTDGGPMTALQLIQSRKPPEPYIPSITEWDLLPDA